MTTSISVDFVRHCETFKSGGEDPEDDIPWRCPGLQILDIQLYGGMMAGPLPPSSSIAKSSFADQHTQRFYLALHDTKAVIWAIAPPGGPLERMIFDGIVEVGSLITLDEYAIVYAANGRRILVALAVSSSVAMPFSLMGTPFVSPSLYHLSRNSLIAKKERMEMEATKERRLRTLGPNGESLQSQIVAHKTKVLLDTLWSHYTELTTFDNINSWHVHVRILWKSKLRRIIGAGGPTEGQALLTQGQGDGGVGQRGGGGKYVFDAILCDEAGDAVRGVFLGKKLFETIKAGCCYRIGGGSVHVQSRPIASARPQKRQRHPYGDEAADEDDQPTELVPAFVQFQEHTWIETIEDQSHSEHGIGEGEENAKVRAEEEINKDNSNESAPTIIPLQPLRLLSGAGDEFIEVGAVVKKASIGDLVSFRGIVCKCGTITDVHTKHGRVDKLTLTVKDRSTSDVIDVTLWGQIALGMTQHLPLRLGTTWCFRDMTVRMFGSMKTISSRGSSEVQPLSAYSYINSATEASSAGRAQEISLTYAGTQLHAGHKSKLHAHDENSNSVTDERETNEALTTSTSTHSISASLSRYPFLISLNQPDAHRQPVPYLLRIQHLQAPFVVLTCQHCRTRADGAHMTENGSYKCSQCGKASQMGTDARFAIHLTLTDGVVCLDATAFGEAAEALCGESITAFMANCRSIGTEAYTNGLIHSLTGLPILSRFTRLGSGQHHITMLQHVDLDACVTVMSEMMDEFI